MWEKRKIKLQKLERQIVALQTQTFAVWTQADINKDDIHFYLIFYHQCYCDALFFYIGDHLK